MRVSVDIPSNLKLGEVVELSCGVENLGPETYTSAPPFPVHLSYRWFDPSSLAIMDDKGHRARLPWPIQPGQQTVISLPVAGPGRPGRYLLRVTLVQELVRWFDDVDLANATSTLLDIEPALTQPERGGIPIPPPDMRALVGPTDAADFDNPSGDPVYPWIPPQGYSSVLDFGCGCGRVARQLMLQRERPRSYLGIDLHRGMILWCQRHLEAAAPGFKFLHHDVQNLGFNPGSDKPAYRPFPAPDSSFTLVNAWSVFTHILQDGVGLYIQEVARVLRPDGYLNATFFLFDKRSFPMMQSDQNALYINALDPSNAVIFDRSWILEAFANAGLKVTWVRPPEVHGYHWILVARPLDAPDPAVELPADYAMPGLARPPVPHRPADQIGVEEE